MEGIRYWIEVEGAGHCFFIAFPIILLCLLLWFKGRRVQFLISSLLISIAIINPLLYKIWDVLVFYAYWRILWVVPVIPIVATIIPSITERIGKISLKAVVTAVGICLVIFGGTFIYGGTGGTFVEAANAAKLPDYVVQIADRLLELDEHPRVIAQDPIGVYIRQYTGEIDTLYGRDLSGYITGGASPNGLMVYGELNNAESDLRKVSQFMLDDGYDYLVIKDRNKTIEELMLVDTVGVYGIYTPLGKPKVIKDRNELGQIVKITYIDDDGQPANNKDGCSTIEYRYDSLGKTIYSFRRDTAGKGVADENGFAGYERAYDQHENMVMERFYLPDGNLYVNEYGYAEVRRIFKNGNITQESYYNDSGSLVNRVDKGFAIIEIEYDENDNKTSEHYYGTDANPIISSYGCASIKRSFDNNRLISEEYYDENRNLISLPSGLAAKKLTYDELGNSVRESYYGESGEPVDCINGYAVIEREYDNNQNVILERFKDNMGRMVVTPSGYAEARFVYSKDNHLVGQEFYGLDGNILNKPGGYVAISQKWDEDTLLSRTYLGMDGTPIDRMDGYATVAWEEDEFKPTKNVKFYNKKGEEVDSSDANLANGICTDADGWSEWMTPIPNKINSFFVIGSFSLGKKVTGDSYTCQTEIEFKNVTATDGHDFRMWTQGATDGNWNAGNIWDAKLVWIDTVPEDGIYKFTSTRQLSEAMTNISNFDIGFRCDYWASGSFRVRNVMIKKGDFIDEWTPGL